MPSVATVNVVFPAVMADNVAIGSLTAMAVDEARGVPRKSGTEDTPPRGAKSPRLNEDGVSLPVVPIIPQFVTIGGDASADQGLTPGQLGLFGWVAGDESSGAPPLGGPVFDYSCCAFVVSEGVRCRQPPVDLLPCRLEAPGVPA